MQNDPDILSQRRAARAAQAESDHSILLMHQRAVAALRDPATAEDTRLDALLTLRHWQDSGLSTSDNIEAWRTILEMEDDDAAERAILDPSEAGIALRQNTPFAPAALRYNA